MTYTVLSPGQVDTLLNSKFKNCNVCINKEYDMPGTTVMYCEICVHNKTLIDNFVGESSEQKDPKI